MARLGNAAWLIGLQRDRGHGTVGIDAAGNAVVRYSLDDAVDVRVAHASIAAQIRIHAAAGADEIVPFAAVGTRWRRGEDLEAFIAAMQRVPLRAGGFRLFSAHQMSSCRMGDDPSDVGRQPVGRAARHARRPHRRRQRAADRQRRQPDDLDHGARPPHGGSDRRGGAVRARGRLRRTMSITVATYDRLYVGGEWVTPLADDTIDVVNPYTEEVIGRIPAAGADDVDRAVAAARAAFAGWAATPAAERAAFLAAIAEKLSERGDELAATISAELGMPIGLSRLIQVGLPTMTFASMPAPARGSSKPRRSATRSSSASRSASSPRSRPGTTRCTRSRPRSPRRSPPAAPSCSSRPRSRRCAPSRSRRSATQVGLPAGVLNLVTGYGQVVGEALTGHPGVDLVTFTGSEGVGRRIGEVTGRNLVPSALELGGKSACIVLDDADLELAVTSCVTRCMINSGQTCIALTRLLVPRERLAEAEAIAAAVAQAHVLGDPFDPATQMGPLVSAAQREPGPRAHPQAECSEGARLVTGGAQPPAGFERGYFVSPTVFSDVRSDMTIAQEEIFGPVLSIIAYDGEEDAIRIANDSRFGLSGAVWAADEARALRVARRHPDRPGRRQRRRLQPVRSVRRRRLPPGTAASSAPTDCTSSSTSSRSSSEPQGLSMSLTIERPPAALLQRRPRRRRNRLVDRRLDHYPRRARWLGYLGIVVAVTVLLYWQLYVDGGAATRILRDLHMSFLYFTGLTAVGAAIGAFASLAAGLGRPLGPREPRRLRRRDRRR